MNASTNFPANFSIMSSDFENGKTSDNPLFESKVRTKLALIESACHNVLKGKRYAVPHQPSRDVEVLPLKLLPDKKGLGSSHGQARLLHDLASIELQAMELAFRSLCEYDEAPMEFRQELAQIAYEESQHLKDCLDALDEMDSGWGHWPVHTALWQATRVEDDLLDRLLIVHRYLEGSGLDAGESLLRKLRGMGSSLTLKVVERIHHEELAHVQFGSRWYRKLCGLKNINPEEDFSERLNKLTGQIPRRLVPLHAEIRKKAGFTEEELNCLRRVQSNQRA